MACTSVSADNQNCLLLSGGMSNSSSGEVCFVEDACRTLSDYPMLQEKGQRIYGPPMDLADLQLERGCEIFIGHIPRDCFEAELVPIFERMGRIHRFRLMIEYDGSNRGYGFCVYTNKEDAKKAVNALNNYEIRPGKTIGVCFSVDNCRLFVGCIPKNKTRDEIFTEMSKITPNVKDVIAYPSVSDKTKNRGFAFVEYTSHDAAAKARRQLQSQETQLWNQVIRVDWAEPEREVNEDIMAKVKILYARNLMLETREDTLREKFATAAGSDISIIERVKKISDYAFIHFKEREFAEKALKLMNNSLIDGSVIEVTWSKPVDKSEAVNKQNLIKTTCLPRADFNTLFTAQALGLQNSQLFTPHLVPQLSGFASLASTPISTRRNAAGSRSASAQKDKKHPIEKLQQTQLNPVSYTELLEDLCLRSGYGIPLYSTYTVQSEAETGSRLTRYFGQVNIPGCNLNYSTPVAYLSSEEAKIAVAEQAWVTLTFSSMPIAYADMLGASNYGPIQTANLLATVSAPNQAQLAQILPQFNTNLLLGMRQTGTPTQLDDYALNMTSQNALPSQGLYQSNLFPTSSSLFGLEHLGGFNLYSASTETLEAAAAVAAATLNNGVRSGTPGNGNPGQNNFTTLYYDHGANGPNLNAIANTGTSPPVSPYVNVNIVTQQLPTTAQQTPSTTTST